MASRVVQKDNGAKALMKRISTAANVTVGIHEDQGNVEHASGGGTVAEVMERHELGLGVPRRSFIADYVDENQTKLEGDLRKIGEAVIAGKVASTEQGLDRFGLHQVGEVQKRIRDGIEPALDEDTIDAKGSATPLIDSGQGWGAIGHRVEPK